MPLLSDCSNTIIIINTSTCLSTTVTNRIGLIIAMQPSILIHGLRKIQVAQEPMNRELEEECQVLELNARDSLKRSLIAWHNMMAINRIGLTNVMLLKIHGLRKTQVELVPTRMRRPVALSLELALNAKVSHKSLVGLNIAVTPKLGLMTANQEEIHSFKITQMPEPVALIQESVLSAKDSQRSKAELNIAVTPKLGLMTANQEEIHSFKITQMPELADHTKVLVSSAKVSQRSKVELNMTVTPKLGLMTVIQVETHSFKPMAALAL
jgi:hypothetical protein